MWWRCGVVPFGSASTERDLRTHHGRLDCLQKTNTNILLLRSGGRSIEKTNVIRTIQGEGSCDAHHHQPNGGKSLKWLLQHRRRRRTLGTGVPCPSRSNHWGLLLFRLPITIVVCITIDKLMYVHPSRVYLKEKFFVQPRICYRFCRGRIAGLGWRRNANMYAVYAAREGGRGGLKEQVELDRQGQSFWAMKELLCSDIKKYAKDLDSTTGWEGHPRSDRKRLLRRLYAGEYPLLLAIWRAKERIHVGLEMHICGCTCTVVISGRLKQHVDVWVDMGISGWTWTCLVGHKHVRLDMRSVMDIMSCILTQNDFICMLRRLADVWRFQQGFWKVDAANYYKGIN